MLCIRSAGIAQMQALLRLMSDNQNFEHPDPAPRPRLRLIAGHAPGMQRDRSGEPWPRQVSDLRCSPGKI